MDVQAHHYYAAKRKDQTANSLTELAKPRWLKTMPQVYGLTANFSLLLDQLPGVRETHNKTVIKDYFKRLVSELVKIYIYRIKIAELSDTIREQDKSAEIDRLLTECNQHVAALTKLLKDNGTSSAV